MWHRLLSCLLLAALTPSCHPEPATEVAAVPQRPSAYDATLTDLDARLAAAVRHAEAHPRDWAHLEAVARLQLGRAKLTGNLEDYLQARQTIDRAFEVAGGPDGPLLERARVALALHQLPQATADLDRLGRSILLRAGESHQLLAMRADVAFQTGRLDEAQAGFAELHRVDPHAGSAFRLALLAWKTGDFDAADRWLVEGEGLAGSDQERAWMALQRGLVQLDQAQYAAAAGHYARADALFPGWWLVEEHQAEVEALQGQTAQAERRYRDLVRRTGNPEFMDALAGLLRSSAPQEADALVAQATAYWQRWLQLLPEAAYGHALEHLLEHGSAAEALDLARRNHTLRPGGDAATLLVRALLGAGQCDEAKERLAAVLATPWRTPDLAEVAQGVAERCGGEAR